MHGVGRSCSNSTKFEVSSTPLTTGTKGGTAENMKNSCCCCLPVYQISSFSCQKKSLETDIVSVFV
jgi:hypothetical protein